MPKITEITEMMYGLCEFCDMDPAECYNMDRCLMERDYEEDSNE